MLKRAVKPESVVILLVIVGLGVAGYLGYRHVSSGRLALPPAPVADLEVSTTAAVRECLAGEDLGTKAVCLDGVFRTYLKSGTTKQALALLRELSDGDTAIRATAHPIAHAIGRETYRKAGTVHGAFQECDATEHSGCYHGAVERAFVPETVAAGSSGGMTHVPYEVVRAKAPALCDEGEKEGVSIYFQCLHGIGHAILFTLNYDIKKGLEVCDLLKTPFDQTSCAGGLFMENVSAFDVGKRQLKPGDPHYPCTVVPEHFVSGCYSMQTSWWRELGFSPERMASECADSGAPVACYTSWGRDLSDEVRIGKVEESASKCGMLADEHRRACIRGAIYALADNTWDASYAFPFCDQFSGEQDRTGCYDDVIVYLKQHREATNELVTRDCSVYSRYRSFCDSISERSSELEYTGSSHR